MDLQTYSVYEAKAQFSALLKKVQKNVRIIITHRGKEIAEIIPRTAPDSFESRIADMQRHGLLEPGKKNPDGISYQVGSSRPGALRRFLDER